MAAKVVTANCVRRIISLTRGGRAKVRRRRVPSRQLNQVVHQHVNRRRGIVEHLAVCRVVAGLAPQNRHPLHHHPPFRRRHRLLDGRAASARLCRRIFRTFFRLELEISRPRKSTGVPSFVGGHFATP